MTKIAAFWGNFGMDKGDGRNNAKKSAPPSPPPLAPPRYPRKHPLLQNPLQALEEGAGFRAVQQRHQLGDIAGGGEDLAAETADWIQ